LGKIRRGGYVFITWTGDHAPRHVHVYRNGRLIVKRNMDARVPMKGRVTARVLRLVAQLEAEGLL